jgi:hypothetical protein
MGSLGLLEQRDVVVSVSYVTQGLRQTDVPIASWLKNPVRKVAFF